MTILCIIIKDSLLVGSPSCIADRTGLLVAAPAAVIILRRTQPDMRRAFRTPLVPVVPILAALICLYLMISLPLVTWVRFIVWLAIGVIIYFAYGMQHSRLGQRMLEEEERVSREEVKDLK